MNLLSLQSRTSLRRTRQPRHRRIFRFIPPEDGKPLPY
jgi:hypothetical protein